MNIDKLVKYYLEVSQLSKGPIELWFHLCNNPRHLHPGVLRGEQELKAKSSIDAAITQLSQFVDKYKTNIDFLKNVSKNLNSIELDTKFLEFTKDLDLIRNQNFKTLL